MTWGRVTLMFVPRVVRGFQGRRPAPRSCWVLVVHVEPVSCDGLTLHGGPARRGPETPHRVRQALPSCGLAQEGFSSVSRSWSSRACAGPDGLTGGCEPGPVE